MSTSHPYQALKKRTTDVLAYFDSPVPSKIRLELLCGSAPGFRNLANYITPRLLEPGGFRPHPHSN